MAFLPSSARQIRESSSKASIAASDSTYYSFHDAHLYEPGTPPPNPSASKRPTFSPLRNAEDAPPDLSMEELSRADSGYESIPGAHPSSRSGSRRQSHSSARRSRAVSSNLPTSASAGNATSRQTGSQYPQDSPFNVGPRPRARPTARRSTASTPAAAYSPYGTAANPRQSGSSLYLTRSYPVQPTVTPPAAPMGTTMTAAAGFPFAPLSRESSGEGPRVGSLVPVGTAVNSWWGVGTASTGNTPTSEDGRRGVAGQAVMAMPPQTTHYWTSDRTRRLEYAAIDAAGRGVKGWVRRHMVPECFIPRERRRVGFEDDGGSVRRYRLEIGEGEDDDSGCDDDDDDEGGARGEKGREGEESKDGRGDVQWANRRQSVA